MVDNPPDIKPGDLSRLVTSGGDHWGPVQTWGLPYPLEQHLVVATKTEAHRFPNGRYASYWNAVLYLIICEN